MNRRAAAATPAAGCGTLATIAAVPAACLFPAVPPRAQLLLPVDGGHLLQVQELGNPGGAPLLVLHGGPGSGASPLLARFFDPARWRILLPDQRGAGRSRPAGRTEANTTADLLADLRALRRTLGIAGWTVAGGSWGATLALAHALDKPGAIAGLLLRASFLARAADIDAFAPPARRSAWQQALADDATAPAAALDWWAHERRLSGDGGAVPDTAVVAAPHGHALDALIARYRVQAHYLAHRCWLDAPPLLDRLHALPAVPTTLLHGTQDRICPPAGARALHQRLPHSRLRWVDGAGHDPGHPAMAAAMVEEAAALLP